MKTIRNYVAGSFVVSFLMTLSVFTFVMSLGVFVRVIDLLSRGIHWGPVLEMFAWGIPASMAFSIPISALTSSLLVFGRLSADGEITAMKASGINLYQVMTTPLLISALLMLLCFHINDNVAPEGFFVQTRIRRELATETPFKLLAEGRMIRNFVDGLNVFIRGIRDNKLIDVRIWDSRDGSTREISAESGVVYTNSPLGGLVIELSNVMVDPLYSGSAGPGFCETWAIHIPADVQQQKSKRRAMYMSLQELGEGVRQARLAADENPRKAGDAMALVVEINKRIVLSVSCVAFVWLGVPLGIRTHRKESSAGVGMSLFLVFNFYLFVVIAESLGQMPEFRPDLIVWAPVVLAAALGAWLTHRAN